MRATIGLAVIGIAIFAGGAACRAQSASSGTSMQSAPAPSTIQGDQSQSLSSKLSQTGGVITPKGDMDPGIKTTAPVPNPKSTPVIPPSATGGQNAK